MNLNIRIRAVVLSALVAPSALAVLVPNSLFVVENSDRLAVSPSPYYLGPAPDGKLFFRFDVPQAQDILSLSSFEVRVTVSDDGDRGHEGADVYLGAGAGEVFLGEISEELPGGSKVFTFSVDPLDFATAIAKIQDNDRVPIQLDRFSGDLFVESVEIEIDAVLVPEPGAYAWMGAGLGTLAILWKRARRGAA